MKYVEKTKKNKSIIMGHIKNKISSIRTQVAIKVAMLLMLD